MLAAFAVLLRAAVFLAGAGAAVVLMAVLRAAAFLAVALPAGFAEVLAETSAGSVLSVLGERGVTKDPLGSPAEKVVPACTVGTGYDERIMGVLRPVKVKSTPDSNLGTRWPRTQTPSSTPLRGAK